MNSIFIFIDSIQWEWIRILLTCLVFIKSLPVDGNQWIYWRLSVNFYLYITNISDTFVSFRILNTSQNELWDLASFTVGLKSDFIW